ncbi:MAG: C40 family peptidase [Bacteroidia bacterium]|nr:C40 family peptidase [Bacteroidia bacterium]
MLISRRGQYNFAYYVGGVLLITQLHSCGVVKKKTTYGKNPSITVEAGEDPTAESRGVQSNGGLPEEDGSSVAYEELGKAAEIIETALGYSGVRYKYGGTTKRGMDCSGLLYVSFTAHDIAIPRVSHQIFDQADPIKMKEVTKGDLLFFKTSRRGKRINHVGLVVDIQDDDIKFIHSTTSRGVIVSSLKEGYWNSAFVKAARIL